MQLHTAIRLQVQVMVTYSTRRQMKARSKSGNTMQIMLIRLAPENELRYVIGVIQNVGAITRNRPTEQRSE